MRHLSFVSPLSSTLADLWKAINLGSSTFEDSRDVRHRVFWQCEIGSRPICCGQKQPRNLGTFHMSDQRSGPTVTSHVVICETQHRKLHVSARLPRKVERHVKSGRFMHIKMPRPSRIPSPLHLFTSSLPQREKVIRYHGLLLELHQIFPHSPHTLHIRSHTICT